MMELREGAISVIKLVYAVTIAAFLIMGMVFGIAAFYEPPESPSYGEPPRSPITYYEPPKECDAWEEWNAERLEFEAEMEEWNLKQNELWDKHDQNEKTHRRNVFFIAYPIGLVLIVAGLEFKPRLEMLRPGLVMGGFGIIIFALSQSDLSDLVRFIGVALGLTVLIYVGYRTLAERGRARIDNK